MRVLFIHTRYLQSAGGEDTTLAAESELMESHGHTVQKLVFDNGEMGAGIIGKIKVGANAIYNFSSARTLKNVVKDFKPDIIHVHNFFFTASPSVLVEASRLNIPLVVTIHNYRLVCANCLLLRDNKVCELCLTHDFPWYGIKYKCYHDSAIQSAMVGGIAAVHKWIGTFKNRVDMFLTPSNFSRLKLIESSFNAPAEKIKVKYNFIRDPGQADPSSRQPFYLFVGRFSAEKGIDVLLEAWTHISDKKLVIAGDGPDQQRILEKYGNLKNVSFIGKQTRDQVLALMKQCRALIFPSIWYEGLPVTIIEALSTGTPVLASALGAMQEMIEDGRNGLLFEEGNANDLTRAVESFDQQVVNGNICFYEQARKSYEQHYQPDKGYETTMNIYNEVINKKRAS